MTWLELSMWCVPVGAVLAFMYLVRKDARTSRGRTATRPMPLPGETPEETARRTRHAADQDRAMRWGWDDGQVAGDGRRALASWSSKQALPTYVHETYDAMFRSSCARRESGQ